MHPRNHFRTGYDIPRLVAKCPALAPFVRTSPRGEDTINFADPDAVMALNQALLMDAYGLRWSIPRCALCPPIPSRCDYIHHLADLLSGGDRAAMARGRAVRVLDIGTGANCIYPLIGASEYGWICVGTEIDKTAMHWARQIVRVNMPVAPLIECRHQSDSSACFAGVVKPGERFAASMCNPPFHASAEEAAEGSRKKRRNLGLAKSAPALNFGGQAGELWCAGGEVGFIKRMIAESATRPSLCRWFTTLVSKSEHLPRLRQALKTVQVTDTKVINMVQGQKKSRILAWTFGETAAR
ncbi:MAG: 23S rRNA (adenine(1618)-N(6))-methyltransferase RlmF [Acidobacteria bacterium]|nr:23S rRNA (adenine(1618)-N(6))-methyltransferase RlmF [Acidobacteriota bacterium]